MEQEPSCGTAKILVSVSFFMIILFMHIAHYPTLLKKAEKKLRNYRR